MGWTNIPSSNFDIDKAATSQDMKELLANVEALKYFPKRVPLGGDHTTAYINTTYQVIEGAIYVEIDGTNIQGLTFQLHFMAKVTSGDLLYARLYNITSAAQIVEKYSGTTVLDLVKSESFSLTTGVNKYRVDVKAATGGAASPVSGYGFHIVQV